MPFEGEGRSREVAVLEVPSPPVHASAPWLWVSGGTCQRSIRAKVSARLAQGLASVHRTRVEWLGVRETCDAVCGATSGHLAGGQCLCVSASERCGAAAVKGRPKARLGPGSVSGRSSR